MRQSGKGQQMTLWKSNRKNDYHFLVLVSAKLQWLTLIFYRNNSFGSPMHWHINLISAKQESPYKSHDLLGVDINQNLCAKEMLEYNFDVCSEVESMEGSWPKDWKTLLSVPSWAVPQKVLLQRQAPSNMLIICHPWSLLCTFVFGIFPDLNLVVYFCFPVWELF